MIDPGAIMTFQVLPLASHLRRQETVDGVVARARERLAGLGHEVVVLEAGDEPRPDQPLLLLVVTGGVEHLALSAASRHPEPPVLLTHADNNSLPAALEVLARLGLEGRGGLIAPLGGDAAAAHRLEAALAAVAARGRLRQSRLGSVGGPSPWLVASSPEPAAVAARHGCRILELGLEELLADIAEVPEVEAGEVARSLAPVDPAGEVARAARVELGLRALVARHRLDAVTVKCFDLLEATGTSGCLALSRLNDEGVVAGCEGDLPALVTMLLLVAAGGGPTFMANPQELSLADRTLWLAHCTVPRRLCSEVALTTHFESGRSVAVAGVLRPGPFTLARLGGADLGKLFMAEGEVVASAASPNRCRTQVLVRLEGGLEELLERPLGNHHVLAPGRLGQALECFRRLYLR